ncbi:MULTISPECIES: ester cyclase [unclassified Dyella]|uniref:ester cyclase n=1 Tax=unclassified Dyella TaxID=2634549 RepID=UPI003F91F378
MAEKHAVQIVERFWREVWQGKNPEAADHIVAEDFGVTSGGVLIEPRVAFKTWVGAFLRSINDFKFDIVEMFPNDAGDRVVTRWIVTGRNNGFMGFEPCQTPIRMTGTSVIHVRKDGLLQHNWVERNALEVQRSLAAVRRQDQ